MLLYQYKFQFGTDFPLKNYEGTPEIDLINIIYDCLQSNNPKPRGSAVKNRFQDAPKGVL